MPSVLVNHYIASHHPFARWNQRWGEELGGGVCLSKLICFAYTWQSTGLWAMADCIACRAATACYLLVNVISTTPRMIGGDATRSVDGDKKTCRPKATRTMVDGMIGGDVTRGHREWFNHYCGEYSTINSTRTGILQGQGMMRILTSSGRLRILQQSTWQAGGISQDHKGMIRILTWVICNKGYRKDVG